MAQLAPGFQSLPAEYQNVLLLAQERNSIVITPLQAIAGGWSGAMVFLVSVASQNPDRVEHLVLKLDRKNEKSQSDEILRHEAAMRCSPTGFAEKHLARMVFDRVEADGILAIFYSIAGQSLHRFRTLSAYERPNQVETIFAHTYRHILNAWNVARTFEQAVHPTTLLERWLAFRLKAGGNIESFIENVCGIAPDVQGVLVSGRVFPNPLAYARRKELWGTARPIDAMIGLQHGDLNTGNILIRFAKNDTVIDGYYLIDFALFKEHMPLVFDLRYLEMSYFILRQSKVSFSRLSDLLMRLGEADTVDPAQAAIDVAGVAAVIAAARSTYQAWIDEQVPSLHDDLWGQYWLAGVAAGLSYVHKTGIPTKDRLTGLLYAAANLKRYLALFGMAAPSEARQLFDPMRVSQEMAAITTSAARTAPQHLPAQATSFIGRQAEASAVQKLLETDSVRLVTLTGPGGVGKTRLSLEVANAVCHRFADGLFFVPLSDVSEPPLVVAKVAQAFGVREAGGQPLSETVKSYLQDKRILLVLDNFEQVVEAAPTVADLLTASAHLKILVTSRIVLQLRGEHEFSVPTLDTPNPSQAIDLARLGQNQSIQLFVDRAQAANSRFTLTPENAAAVTEICQRLDGLPLAIELAAARIKLLSPQAILNKLENRLSILTGGARDLPARHQTLRNSLDLSHGMLRAHEQALFARLGVFVGGFTLETAEAVCNADESVDVLDSVTSLVNNSLLQTEDGLDGQPRFRMLETIREYALERLDGRGERTSMHEAHGLYYLKELETDVAVKLFTLEGPEQLDWLESEHANILAALSWGLTDPKGTELAIVAIGVLVWYWYRRGNLNEGRTWSDRVMHTPFATGETPGRAWAMLCNALLATWQGDLRFARVRIDEAVALAKRLEDPAIVAIASLNKGVVHLNMGDDVLARPALYEAMMLFKELGSRSYYTTTLVHLGNVALGLGKLTEAHEWLNEAHKNFHDVGDQWLYTFILNNLGELSRVRGDYAGARRYYEESVALLRTMGDKGDIARLVHNLGRVALHEGNPAKAEAQFTEGVSLFRIVGSRRGIAECLAAFSALRSSEGQLARAARLYGAAEALLSANGAAWWPADRGENEQNRAALAAKLGEAAFEAELAAGRAMSMEQAIALALEERTST